MACGTVRKHLVGGKMVRYILPDEEKVVVGALRGGACADEKEEEGAKVAKIRRKRKAEKDRS